MSKVKVKCARCGKHFKSSSAKQTICADCEARERRERAAAKVSGPATAKATPAAPIVAPKIVGPGASILVPGLAPAPAEPEQARSEPRHAQAGTPGHGDDKPARAPRADGASTSGKSPRPPKPPKTPKPPTPPFTVTDEMRATIEARYLELAQPVEFDGIRTQIAAELQVPKVAVKAVIRDLRDHMRLPSWWELRAYTGGEEELERIRAAYLPLLPVPEVGVHKRLAEDLGLSPIMVYQGIRRIRAEMRLPQYNPPEAHEQSPQPAAAAPVPEQAPSASGTP